MPHAVTATTSPITTSIKDELARAVVPAVCCRRTETTAVLRFAAVLHRTPGRIVVEAQLPTGLAAYRLRTDLAEVFGHRAEVSVHRFAGGTCDRHRWRVRVAAGAAVLTRQAGLAEAGVGPGRGPAARVFTGPACDAAAFWRGALLACTWTLSEPGDPPALGISCPGVTAPTAALVAAARRLGLGAALGPGGDTTASAGQVVLSGRSAISAVLTRVGAPTGAAIWQARLDRHARGVAPVPTFTAANAARAAQATHTALTQTIRALEVLAPRIAAGQVPAHLLCAARLRLAHPHATLCELAALSAPPLSKDTIAGRLRQLHLLADGPATGS